MSDTPAPKLARIFAALCIGVRIRIIRNIAKRGTVGAWKAKQGRGCTIKEAGLGLRIGWPTLSHHVSVLEKVGMITISRHGRFKRCWISSEAMSVMSEFFMSLGPRIVPNPPKDFDKHRK
jgi:DNA-binding transcriptional ArsR family regulator